MSSNKEPHGSRAKLSSRNVSDVRWDIRPDLLDEMFQEEDEEEEEGASKVTRVRGLSCHRNESSAV